MNLEKIYKMGKLIKCEFYDLNFWKFDANEEFDKWSKLNKNYTKRGENLIFFKLNT